MTRKTPSIPGPDEKAPAFHEEALRDPAHRQSHEVDTALQESEERYRTLFQNVAEGILVATTDTHRFIHANPAICRMLGYSHAEITSMGVEDLHPKEDLTRVLNEFVALYKGKKVRVEDIPCIKKDGTILFTDVTASHTMIDGKMCNVGLFSDITERKQMEEELRQSNHKLRLLTSLTRHDILNQLTAIDAFLYFVRDAENKEAMEQYILKARETLMRIEATVGFTREYEHFGLFSSGWKPVYPIIESAMSEITLGRVAVMNQIPPSLEIHTDPIIRKVFATLLDNSMQHGKTVTVIRFSTQEQQDGLIIAYEDDGVGIAKKEKTRIFERGYGNNTGIGLYLAREILSITGFSMQETGKKGKGVRFEIHIPKPRFRLTSPVKERAPPV